MDRGSDELAGGSGLKEAVAVYVCTTMFYVAAMVLFGPLVASVLGGIVVLVILAFLYAAGSDTPV
jgi:hypothetical protein